MKTVLFMTLLGSAMGLKVETARPQETTMKSADPNLRFVQQHADTEDSGDPSCPAPVGNPNENWMQTLLVDYGCVRDNPGTYNWCKKDQTPDTCGDTCFGWKQGNYPIDGWTNVKPSSNVYPSGAPCAEYELATNICLTYDLPATGTADVSITEDHKYCVGCQSIFIMLLNPQCYLWGPCWGKAVPNTQWAGFNDGLFNYWVAAFKCIVKTPVETISGASQMAAVMVSKAGDWFGPLVVSGVALGRGAFEGALAGVAYLPTNWKNFWKGDFALPGDFILGAGR